MFRKILLFSLVLCVAVVLTSCGGAKPEPISLTLHAQDIMFDVDTLTVKVGQPVELTYINEGSIDHAFRIDDLVAEQKVRSGETYLFRFTATKEGIYRYVCAIPGHEQAGMVGTLLVE